MVLLIGLHGCHRTGKVRLTGYTVADDHDGLQHLGIVLQRDDYAGRSADRHGLEAHRRDGDLGTFLGFHRKVSVKVGDHTARLSGNTYRRTDDGFSLSIFHMAFHVNLRESTYR